MAKLLVWNIERFAAGTLADRRVVHYIWETVLDAKPDILVIIEGQTGGSGGAGTLISDTSGRAGVLGLWNQLGRFDPAAAARGGWALVPPMLINPGISRNNQGDAARNGYSESIVVFFRPEKLDFLGPYKWTKIGSVAQINLQPAEAYVGDFAQSLPTTLPLNSTNGLNQNELAGQAAFESNNVYIDFGGSVNKGFLARSPWHTQFVENSGATQGRIIKVWAVHLDPAPAEARYNMDALSRIPEITNPLVGNEVRVICGDFNLSPDNGNDKRAFEKFTANGPTYDESGGSRSSRSSGSSGPPGRSTDIYKMFLDKGGSATMLRPTQPTVTPAGDERRPGASVQGDPPYYSYMKSKMLDNILVAPKNIGKNFTVINRVVGTEYSAFDIFREYPVAMARTIESIRFAPTWTQWWKFDFHPDQDKVFRRPENYGHIRDTSDHMALVIEF